MKKLLIKIITNISAISIFAFIFFGSILITQGYRYNFHENEVVQTGVIDICPLQKDVTLYLDGEPADGTACTKLFGLSLGSHTLSLRKSGYISWEKRIYIDAYVAHVFKDVLLVQQPEFRTLTTLANNIKKMWVSPDASRWATYDPKLKVVQIFFATKAAPQHFEIAAPLTDLTWIDNETFATETKKGRTFISLGKKPFFNSGILVRPLRTEQTIIALGNELYEKTDFGARLITRYSEPIESAQPFVNNNSLLITTSTDIRLCDAEGENCQILSKKDTGTAVAHPAGSKKIIFIKDGKLLQLSLAMPVTEDSVSFQPI